MSDFESEIRQYMREGTEQRIEAASWRGRMEEKMNSVASHAAFCDPERREIKKEIEGCQQDYRVIRGIVAAIMPLVLAIGSWIGFRMKGG